MFISGSTFPVALLVVQGQTMMMQRTSEDLHGHLRLKVPTYQKEGDLACTCLLYTYQIFETLAFCVLGNSH